MSYLEPLIKILVCFAMVLGTVILGKEILFPNHLKPSPTESKLAFMQEQQLFVDLENLETAYYKTEDIEKQKVIRLEFIKKVKAYSPDYLPVDLQIFYNTINGRDH